MEEEEEIFDSLFKTFSGFILKILIEKEQKWENSVNEHCLCVIKTSPPIPVHIHDLEA